MGTKIKSDAKSATIYSSWHNNKSTFIDGLVGYGYIDNDLTRIEQANTSNYFNWRIEVLSNILLQLNLIK